MASDHRYIVVLPTRQVREITVGVTVVAFSIVAETALSIHSIRCGTLCCIPCNHSDTGVAVHLGCEVGGNTWSWWRERGRCVAPSLSVQSPKAVEQSFPASLKLVKVSFVYFTVLFSMSGGK